MALNVLAPSIPLGSEFISALDRLSSALQLNEIPFKTYDERSLKDFMQIAPDKQREVIENAIAYTELIPSGPLAKFNLAVEKSVLQKVFKRLSIYPKDNFMDYIEEGDIIEIYTSKFIQVYRNLEFFRYCGYTLVDLLIKEWYMLYERPKSVTDVLYQISSNTLENGLGTVPYNVKEHILRERYLGLNKAFKIRMKYLCPLVDQNTGVTQGLVHSMSAETISVDHDKIVYF